jgi:hypothetical protein
VRERTVARDQRDDVHLLAAPAAQLDPRLDEPRQQAPAGAAAIGGFVASGMAVHALG